MVPVDPLQLRIFCDILYSVSTTTDLTSFYSEASSTCKFQINVLHNKDNYSVIFNSIGDF